MEGCRWTSTYLGYHVYGESSDFLSVNVLSFREVAVPTWGSGGPPSSLMSSRWLWPSTTISFLKRPPAGSNNRRQRCRNSGTHAPLLSYCGAIDVTAVINLWIDWVNDDRYLGGEWMFTVNVIVVSDQQRKWRREMLHAHKHWSCTTISIALMNFLISKLLLLLPQIYFWLKPHV